MDVRVQVFLRTFDAVILGDGSLRFVQNLLEDLVSQTPSTGPEWPAGGSGDRQLGSSRPTVDKRTFFDMYDF